jgi:hypothetical protein
LLIWDQEVVHGSQPNSSDEWRLAQFIKAFRKGPLTCERAAARKRAVGRLIAAAGTAHDVTPLGSVVFGLGE